MKMRNRTHTTMISAIMMVALPGSSNCKPSAAAVSSTKANVGAAVRTTTCVQFCAIVGDTVGVTEGETVGDTVGWDVIGLTEGDTEGETDGETDGEMVRVEVLGNKDGKAVGEIDGDTDGLIEGETVGDAVGDAVGADDAEGGIVWVLVITEAVVVATVGELVGSRDSCADGN